MLQFSVAWRNFFYLSSGILPVSLLTFFICMANRIEEGSLPHPPRYRSQLTALLFAVRYPANVCLCKHGSRLPGISRKKPAWFLTIPVFKGVPDGHVRNNYSTISAASSTLSDISSFMSIVSAFNASSGTVISLTVS